MTKYFLYVMSWEWDQSIWVVAAHFHYSELALQIIE